MEQVSPCALKRQASAETLSTCALTRQNSVESLLSYQASPASPDTLGCTASPHGEGDGVEVPTPGFRVPLAQKRFAIRMQEEECFWPASSLDSLAQVPAQVPVVQLPEQEALSRTAFPQRRWAIRFPEEESGSPSFPSETPGPSASMEQIQVAAPVPLVQRRFAIRMHESETAWMTSSAGAPQHRAAEARGDSSAMRQEQGRLAPKSHRQEGKSEASQVPLAQRRFAIRMRESGDTAKAAMVEAQAVEQPRQQGQQEKACVAFPQKRFAIRGLEDSAKEMAGVAAPKPASVVPQADHLGRDRFGARMHEFADIDVSFGY
jgi:hypothetical protein